MQESLVRKKLLDEMSWRLDMYIRFLQDTSTHHQIPMKIIKLSITTSLLFCALTGLQAQDQTVEISPQAVTIALTAKSFVGGTFEVNPDTGKLTKIPAFESVIETYDKNDNLTKSVTTYAAKAITGKLGNAQILPEVVEGSISGWSIVLKSDEEGTPAVWAVKTANKVVVEEIDLSELISFETQTSGAYNITETYTAKYTPGSDEEPSELIEGSEKTTITGKGTDEGPISMNFAETALVGSFVQPWTGLSYNPDSTDKSVLELALIPGAGRVTGVIGIAEDEEAGSTIYGGGINLSAAKGQIVSPVVE